MRAVIQRVKEAQVRVEGEVVARIEEGILALVGVEKEDSESDADWLASKIAELRIFEDAEQKMNLSVKDVGGSILVVSQFTLLGDCRKGRRPSFDKAAPPDVAESLYLLLVDRLKNMGINVQTGKFAKKMEVELINDGPVTLLLDSRKNF